MVTNVTSLLKTVKTVEDEAARGTRALESTIEAICQEIKVFGKFSLRSGLSNVNLCKSLHRRSFAITMYIFLYNTTYMSFHVCFFLGCRLCELHLT